MTDISYTQNFMLGSMSNKEKLQEGLYYSGLNQLEVLMDMELMLEEAKLTEKQSQVVRLYYFKQYTQEEVSQVMGITQQAVLDHIKKVKLKIKKVLERWANKDV